MYLIMNFMHFKNKVIRQIFFSWRPSAIEMNPQIPHANEDEEFQVNERCLPAQ